MAGENGALHVDKDSRYQIHQSLTIKQILSHLCLMPIHAVTLPVSQYCVSTQKKKNEEEQEKKKLMKMEKLITLRFFGVLHSLD